MAEFEEGFGDGAGVRAGEAEDADAAASGRGGDGDDGVVVFGHFLMVLCQYFFGLVFRGGRGVFTRGMAICTGVIVWCFRWWNVVVGVPSLVLMYHDAGRLIFSSVLRFILESTLGTLIVTDPSKLPITRLCRRFTFPV
jgi:hypothetical protein